MNAPASIAITPLRAADLLAAKGQGHASVTDVSDSCQITLTDSDQRRRGHAQQSASFLGPDHH